jgi:hypothetical protein
MLATVYGTAQFVWIGVSHRDRPGINDRSSRLSLIRIPPPFLPLAARQVFAELVQPDQRVGELGILATAAREGGLDALVGLSLEAAPFAVLQVRAQALGACLVVELTVEVDLQ